MLQAPDLYTHVLWKRLVGGAVLGACVTRGGSNLGHDVDGSAAEPPAGCGDLGSHGSPVRVYAVCTPPAALATAGAGGDDLASSNPANSPPSFKRGGAVTLTVVNLLASPANITLALAGASTQGLAHRIEYIFTANPGHNATAVPSFTELMTRVPALNGVLLRPQAGGNRSLPDVAGMGKRVLASGHAGATLVMPPRSYGFVVLPGAGATACSGPAV